MTTMEEKLNKISTKITCDRTTQLFISKIDLDSINIKDLIRLFLEYFLPKRNTYHNCGDFFWAKQTEEETPEKF